MPGTRFPFSVHQSGDSAVVAMDCGGGVVRARHMPGALLKTLGELCRRLEARAKEAAPDPSEIPLYPGFLSFLKARLPGACEVTMGAHRLPDGAVEHLIAIYDDGDDSAPVLILIEEQIEEFIRQT